MQFKWESLFRQHDALFRQAFAETSTLRSPSTRYGGATDAARWLHNQGQFSDLTLDHLRQITSTWLKYDDYQQTAMQDQEPLVSYTSNPVTHSIPAQSGVVSVSSSTVAVSPSSTPAAVKSEPAPSGFTSLITQYQTASQARMLADGRVQRHYKLPDGIERIGVLCDIHGPHRDKAAVEMAVEFLHAKNLDCLVLNGDAMDLTAVSRWPTKPTEKASLPDELEDGRHLLRAFGTYFSQAKLVWSFGNHEERMENYLIRRAPELFNVDGIDLPSLLHIDYNKWTVIEQKAIMQVDDYYMIHGHETSMKTGGIIPAKKLYDITGVQAIAGHFHRTSSHRFKRMNGELVKSYTVGCLCELDPNYAPFNQWNHGFLYMEKRQGQWRIENYIIDSGEIYLSQ